MTKSLRAAACPKRVAMPRFRRATAQSTRLSEVVNRALTRAFGCAGAFGIFLTDGKCRMVSVNTEYFNTMQKKGSCTLIGTYDKTVKVADLTDDLSEFFSDEVA